MTIELIEGDCHEVLREFADNSIDSVVTDPPYALTTGKKGGRVPASLNVKSPAGRSRVTTGFMGKAWDNGDTAFDPTFWTEALRVLKPGGHILAFGGTRTYHRLACAIEDAGFEIRDQIGWLYGSGFPKSSNQDDDWQGWGTALKPAWEPIVVARKPLDGTVAQNLARWGVGALNIDGCRIGDEVITTIGAKKLGTNAFGDYGGMVPKAHVGRWPANVIHDGSDEVLDAFPDSNGSGPARVLKRSSGTRDGDWGMNAKDADEAPLRDAGKGSAARFFYCAKASKKDRNNGVPPKPDGKPGNDHPTVKPTELMRYLCRLVTPPGGTVFDPFMGSGSTGRGAVLEGFNFIGCELDPAYVDIADVRIAAAETQLTPSMQAAE